MMKSNSERRRFRRRECFCPVDLDDYESASSGFLRNLGIGGASIETRDKTRYDIGQELILTIPYKTRPDYLIIKAKVAWSGDACFGVQFLKTSVGENAFANPRAESNAHLAF